MDHNILRGWYLVNCRVFGTVTNRYLLIEILGGIADTDMKFKGIDGINFLRFGALECAGCHVGWDEADYPIDSEDYLIKRELMKLKRHFPEPVDLFSMPCMASQTSTILYILPTLLVVRVPFRPCQLSPLERRACLSCYRTYDRTRGPHMVSDRCINRWSVSSSGGSPSLLSPVLGTTVLPLFLLIILSQPSSMLVPLLLVLFLLLVLMVENLAILPDNVMTTTDPAFPIIHRYTHLQLLLLIQCLFLTGHPFLAIPPLPQVPFNQRHPTISRK